MPLQGYVIIDRSSSMIVEGTHQYDRANGGILVAPAGEEFPETPTAGEFFWNLTDGKLYRRNTANDAWENCVGHNTGFGITVDGSGSEITTGSKGYVRIPYACTITGWTLVADIDGDIVIDVKLSSYAAFPATASIAGTEKPTLTSSVKDQLLVLTDWDTAVAEGDMIEFVVDSVTDVTRVNLQIHVLRT